MLGLDWYEFGWGKSFHFSHWLRNETFDEATARHEHRIVDSIRIAPGDKILDVGSGVGGPARAIAAYSGAHVTGITINEYQIGRSRELTKEAGLDQQISFVQVTKRCYHSCLIQLSNRVLAHHKFTCLGRLHENGGI